MSPLKREVSLSRKSSALTVLYREHRPLIGFIAFIAIFAGGYFMWSTYDHRINSLPSLRLSTKDNLELYRSVPYQIKAFYDPDGRYGSAAEQDVTFSASWDAKGVDVAYVGKAEPTSGTIFPVKSGTASILVSFAGISKTVSVRVIDPPLVVTCEPRHIQPDEKGVFVTTKGSEVEYVAVYVKAGVADYKYQWRAEGGQTSTEILPRFTFNEVGTHVVEATITDRANTTVNIKCTPLQVIEG